MSFKTALHAKHCEAGAKMVDFAGWEMPLYYGSQIEEHNAVRKHAGMFDVSHMNVVDIKGEDAHAFLGFLFANDIDKLKIVGQALYSCMLNEQGFVIDDLIVYRITEQDYRVVVNASTHDKDMTWINAQAQKFNVKITERTDLAMIAIQGPQAREIVAKVFNNEQNSATANLKPFSGVAVGEWWIARTGYTGEDGYEIALPAFEASIFWQQLKDAGVAPCGLVARDSLRLEAGLSLYGSEMDETVSPLESNLTWTVAFTPEERNFMGKTALLQQKTNGTKRNIFGVVLEDKGMLRSHQKVIVPNCGEGETTSGGFSPILNTAIALARLPKESQVGDACFVVVRDKQLKARIIKPPFVKNGVKNF